MLTVSQSNLLNGRKKCGNMTLSVSFTLLIFKQVNEDNYANCTSETIQMFVII